VSWKGTETRSLESYEQGVPEQCDQIFKSKNNLRNNSEKVIESYGNRMEHSWVRRGKKHPGFHSSLHICSQIGENSASLRVNDPRPVGN
jgi:hypothetical protein